MTIDELRSWIDATEFHATSEHARRALRAALDVVQAAKGYPVTGHLAEALHAFDKALGRP